MTLQICLLLKDCLVEATITEMEGRICGRPKPRLPIFAAEGSDEATWPPELKGMAELARRCCCAEPGERLRAAELRAFGFSAAELHAAGFGEADLLATGSSAAELLVADCNAADRLSAGFR